MTCPPRLKGKEIICILECAGSRAVRTKGSQTFRKHPDGRATVVPVHSSETIGPGLLRAILRDVEVSVDDLLE
jgi:predicted RNA binding protein YcfA (HicA-like mRNA interferase family)